MIFGKVVAKISKKTKLLSGSLFETKRDLSSLQPALGGGDLVDIQDAIDISPQTLSLVNLWRFSL